MSKVVFKTVKKSLFVWMILCSSIVLGQNAFETSFFSGYESIISGEEKIVRNSWSRSDRAFLLSEVQDSLSWESEQLPDYYSNSFARFFFAGGMNTTDSTSYTLWLDQKALFQFQPQLLEKDTVLYSTRGSSLAFHEQKKTDTTTEFFVELRLPLLVLSLGEQIQLKLTNNSKTPHRFWLYDLKPQAPFVVKNKGVSKRGFKMDIQKLELSLYYFNQEKPAFRLDVNGKPRVLDTLQFGYNKWDIEIEGGSQAKWTELDMFRNDSLVKYIGYESNALPYHEIYLVPKIKAGTVDSVAIDRALGHIPGMRVLNNILKDVSETDRMKWMHQLQTGAVSFNLSSDTDMIGNNLWANYYNNFKEGLLFAKEHNLNGKSLQLNNPFELSESFLPFLKEYGIDYLSIKEDDLPLLATKEIDKHPYFFWKKDDQKVLCEWFHHTQKSSSLSELAIAEQLERASHHPYKISRMDIELEGVEELRSFVNYWNTTYSNPKLIISSLDQYFEKFNQEYGEKIPELSYEFIGFSPVLTDVFPERSQEISELKASNEMMGDLAIFAPELFLETYQKQAKLLADKEAYIEKLASANVVEEQCLVSDTLAIAAVLELKHYQNIPNESDSVFVAYNAGEALETAYLEIPEKWSKGYLSAFAGKKEQAIPVQRMSDGGLLVYLEKVPAYGTVRIRLSALPATANGDLELTTSSLSNSRLDISFHQNGYLNGLQRKDAPSAYIYENDVWGGIFKQSGTSLSLWESSATMSIEENGPLCKRIKWVSQDNELRYTRYLTLYAWADRFEWEVELSLLSDTALSDNYLSFPFLLEKPTYKYQTSFGVERDKAHYNWKRRAYRLPEGLAYQVEGLQKACQISMSKAGPLYRRRLDFVSDWLPSYGDNGFLYQLSSRNHKEPTFRETFRFRPGFHSNEFVASQQELMVLPAAIAHREDLLNWDDKSIVLRYLRTDSEGDILAVFYNSSSEEHNLKLKTDFKKKFECDSYGEAQRNLSGKKKMPGHTYLFVKLHP